MESSKEFEDTLWLSIDIPASRNSGDTCKKGKLSSSI